MNATQILLLAMPFAMTQIAMSKGIDRRTFIYMLIMLCLLIFIDNTGLLSIVNTDIKIISLSIILLLFHFRMIKIYDNYYKSQIAYWLEERGNEVLDVRRVRGEPSLLSNLKRNRHLEYVILFRTESGEISELRISGDELGCILSSEARTRKKKPGKGNRERGQEPLTPERGQRLLTPLSLIDPFEPDDPFEPPKGS